MGNSAFVSQQGSGSGARLTVNQSNNFASGDVVRFDTDTSTYIKAQADTAINAEAIGVVESSTTTTANIVFSGLVDLSEGAPDTGSFAGGTVYFLSNAVAGKLTATPPSTTGTVRKSMVTMMSTTKGVVTNYIGLQNGVGGDNLVDLSEVQPVGTIAPFAGDDTQVPKGWLLCNGGFFSSIDYPDLAIMVGDVYGGHEGNNYYLPDFRGRVAMGVNSQSEQQDRDDARATRQLGSEAGSEDVALTLSNLPAHSHIANYKVYEDDAIGSRADLLAAVADGTGPFDIAPGTGQEENQYSIPGDNILVNTIIENYPITSNDWLATATGQDYDTRIVDRSVNVASSGSSSAFSVMNPHLTVNFIIKASAQANAALFTSNLSSLSDFDSSRGGTSNTDVDSMAPGDIVSFNSSESQFILKPDIVADSNLMGNPLLRVSQRGTSFNDTTASSFHTMDRWYYSRSGSAAFTVSRETTGRPAPGIISANGTQVTNYNSPPMSYWMKITKNNDTTTSANGFYTMSQAIEGYDFQKLWGSDFFTFSFLVKNDNATTGISDTTPLTVVFRNAANNRSYVAPFTSSTEANGWVRKKVIVPMQELQFANWQFEEGIGLQVSFVLSAGTNTRTTTVGLNNWKSDNLYGAPDHFNCNEPGRMSVGGYIGLTQFQLEPGAYATNIKFPTGGEELRQLQRYYQKSYNVGTVPGSTDVTNNAPVGLSDPAISNTVHDSVNFRTTMRAKPNVRLYDPYGGGSSRSNGNLGTIYPIHSGLRDGVATAVNSIGYRGTNGFTQIALNNDLGNYSQGDNLIHFHYTAEAEMYQGYQV